MTRDQSESEILGGPGVAKVDAGGTLPQGDTHGVMATPWAGQDWALVVGSGSDLVELYDQIARLPTGLAFAEAFGDVDLVLVYRPADQAPSRRERLGMLVDQAVDHGGTLVGPVSRDGLSASDRYETAAERAAFRAGQEDALGAVRRALTGA